MQRLWAVRKILIIATIIGRAVPCWVSAGIVPAARVPVFGIGVVTVTLPARTRTAAVAFVINLFERGIKRETPLPLKYRVLRAACAECRRALEQRLECRSLVLEW